MYISYTININIICLCCCGLDAKLYPTLWDPMDCNLPGASFHGISQQEDWRGLPFPPPGDLPDLGIECLCPAMADRLFTAEPSGKQYVYSSNSNEFYAIKKKMLSPATKPFSCAQMQCATYQQNINQKTKIKLYLSNLFDFALKNNFSLFHISLPLMRMLLYWVA